MKTCKICMLGDFAVGKTSLVRKFVDQVFSEKYLTTVGVKIDTKQVESSSGPVKFVLWDIAGSADLDALKSSYVRGMAGYLLVCDGTRAPTLTSAKTLHQGIVDSMPPLPFLLLVNKSDLTEETEIPDADLDALEAEGWSILRTSAKSGENVERAFRRLADLVNDGQSGEG